MCPFVQVETQPTFSLPPVTARGGWGCVQYGKQLVIMSDEMKNHVKYKPGEKGLQLVGFVNAQNVPRHLLLKVSHPTLVCWSMFDAGLMQRNPSDPGHEHSSPAAREDRQE